MALQPSTLCDNNPLRNRDTVMIVQGEKVRFLNSNNITNVIFFFLLVYCGFKFVAPTEEEQEEMMEWMKNDKKPEINTPLDMTMEHIKEKMSRKQIHIENRADYANSNSTNFVEKSDLR